MSQLNNTTFRTCFPLLFVTEDRKSLCHSLGRPSRSDFVQLKFVEATPASAASYYAKKINRDKSAQQEYRKQVKTLPNTSDLFMLDIMREGIKDGDKRLL